MTPGESGSEIILSDSDDDLPKKAMNGGELSNHVHNNGILSDSASSICHKTNVSGKKRTSADVEANSIDADYACPPKRLCSCTAKGSKNDDHQVTRGDKLSKMTKDVLKGIVADRALKVLEREAQKMQATIEKLYSQVTYWKEIAAKLNTEMAALVERQQREAKLQIALATALMSKPKRRHVSLQVNHEKILSAGKKVPNFSASLNSEISNSSSDAIGSDSRSRTLSCSKAYDIELPIKIKQESDHLENSIKVEVKREQEDMSQYNTSEGLDAIVKPHPQKEKSKFLEARISNFKQAEAGFVPKEASDILEQLAKMVTSTDAEYHLPANHVIPKPPNQTADKQHDVVHQHAEDKLTTTHSGLVQQDTFASDNLPSKDVSRHRQESQGESCLNCSRSGPQRIFNFCCTACNKSNDKCKFQQTTQGYREGKAPPLPENWVQSSHPLQHCSRTEPKQIYHCHCVEYDKPLDASGQCKSQQTVQGSTGTAPPLSEDLSFDSDAKNSPNLSIATPVHSKASMEDNGKNLEELHSVAKHIPNNVMIMNNRQKFARSEDSSIDAIEVIKTNPGLRLQAPCELQSKSQTKEFKQKEALGASSLSASHSSSMLTKDLPKNMQSDTTTHSLSCAPKHKNSLQLSASEVPSMIKTLPSTGSRPTFQSKNVVQCQTQRIGHQLEDTRVQQKTTNSSLGVSSGAKTFRIESLTELSKNVQISADTQSYNGTRNRQALSSSTCSKQSSDVFKTAPAIANQTQGLSHYLSNASSLQYQSPRDTPVLSALIHSHTRSATQKKSQQLPSASISLAKIAQTSTTLNTSLPQNRPSKDVPRHVQMSVCSHPHDGSANLQNSQQLLPADRSSVEMIRASTLQSEQKHVVDLTCDEDIEILQEMSPARCNTSFVSASTLSTLSPSVRSCASAQNVMVQRGRPPLHSTISSFSKSSITTWSSNSAHKSQPPSANETSATKNLMQSSLPSFPIVSSRTSSNQTTLLNQRQQFASEQSMTSLFSVPPNQVRQFLPSRIQPGTISSTQLQAIRHPAPLPEAEPPTVMASTTKLPPPAPKLSISKVANGLVLTWDMELSLRHANISSYHIFSYEDTEAAPSTSLWTKISDIKALPLPMAVTLRQFVDGRMYYFAVRAKDCYSRLGKFCAPRAVFFPEKAARILLSFVTIDH